MKKSFVFVALMLALTGVSTVIFPEDIQRHPFLNDKELCNICHVIYNITGTTAKYIAINADSTSFPTDVCLECHPHRVADHPVHIVVPYEAPKDLPLTKKREITCITCHNPHYERFSNRPWMPRSIIQKMYDFFKGKKQYKTYFLRRNNSQGELCISCHRQVRRHIW